MDACEGHRADCLPQVVPITSRIPRSLLTPTYTLLPLRGSVRAPLEPAQAFTSAPQADAGDDSVP